MLGDIEDPLQMTPLYGPSTQAAAAGTSGISMGGTSRDEGRTTWHGRNDKQDHRLYKDTVLSICLPAIKST